MMNISVLLSDDEINDLQQSLYNYFETGYAFEHFLKEYLIQMGLDEVEVTQRSRDGGIDIKAIRKGLGDFSDVDITHYYIQAKRYVPGNRVSVTKVRELKGTIPFGYKGMLITTSDFTKDAITEAANDPSKPVVLINGKALVTSCIDHQIGFLFKPYFSKGQMDRFLRKEESIDANAGVSSSVVTFSAIDGVEKELTANDIRARIISIPSAIMKQFDDALDSIRFLYKGIIIKHNKTEPTYTKTSLFLCEKRRFFMARTEKGVVTTI
jgi:restriction system protein